MPRKKNKLKGKHAAKGSAKGSAKSTPQRTPARPPPWLAAATAAAATPSLSMRDEARYVSGHRSAAFEAGKQLRHMPIAFVSAGRLAGTLEEPSSPVDTDADADAESADAASLPSSAASPVPDNTAAMAHMAIRSPSPALSHSSSDSSADVVIFRGRGNLPPSHAATDAAPPASAPPASASVGLSIRVKAFESASVLEPEPQVDADTGDDTDVVVQDDFAKRRGNKPEWEGTTTPWVHRSKPGIGWLPVDDRPDMDALLDEGVDPQDAAMDDYMQNIDDFGLTGDMLKASGFARREMDLDAGSHNDWESASGSQAGEEQDGWDSAMLKDLEDLSTSSDVMDTVVRILSRRTRKSGMQYLCVYEGSLTDDARWLPSSCLKGPTERDLVRIFEEERRLREQEQLDTSDSTDNNGDDDDDDDDNDSEDDDDSDEQLDDETIARVLQKQEELGLGSDELMLFAADDYFGGSTRANDFHLVDNFVRPHKKGRNRGRGKREITFPSASAMADALDMDPYNGFDIMDTERPSLRPKKKGRRGQIPPELDDSDLNEQLQNAWEVDRSKKRLKKAEREQLRQQGMLGRKGKAPDLKVKYKDGMDMEEIVEEIREFMLGDMQTLALPPMDASRRATIHQAADHFKLTSRSRGDGLDRFTILAKTSRTRTFTDSEFDRAIIHKGLLYRLRGPLQSQKGGGRFTKSVTVRHGGARARTQTGYQDGETVGANAPELGPENKGHALLSKMGWSKGMGLGALDNKGILQPITHTVKMTKAGLQ